MERINLKDLALRKVKINGNILGKFGTFDIEQTYKNNTDKVLEVFYTFPISATATVTGFEIKVGDKVLKGDVKEKEEAKKEYVDNIVKGNSAYLMEQDEDNSFKISIGKLDKNEEVKVKITYIDKFEIVDNTINVLIPTLIKPRYNSDVTKKQIYTSDKNKHIEYNVDFNIEISKSIKVRSVESVTNTIKVEDKSDGGKKVIIENAKMNKDFKLNIELRKEETSSGVLFNGKDGDKYLYLSFMPEIEEINDKEKDYIFIADKSGSMMGSRIEGLKEAMKKCLQQLDEGDTFNIIPFSHEISFMNIKSIEYNDENVEKAEKYIDNLSAMGGTEILKPLQFALYDDNTEREKVILLFTDGEVGNTDQIYSEIKQNINNARIFPFGIDSSVNVSFIKQIAKYGHGKAEFISKDEKIEDKVLRTFARIQSPLVENIRVDFVKTNDVERIEEEDSLFNYEFYNVIAKTKEIKDNIVLKGTVNGNEYSWNINKDDLQKTDMNIELVFQSAMIDLLEEYIHACKWTESERIELYKNKIIEIATKYNINSKYTSFITINEREEKITEVPTMQNTPLTMERDDFASMVGSSAPRMRRARQSFDSAMSVEESAVVDISIDIPPFLQKHTAKVKQPKDVFEEYYNKFTPKCDNEEDLVLFLLLNLYLLKKKKSIKEYELENYIQHNIDTIKNSKNKEGIIKLLLLLTFLIKEPLISKIKEFIIDIDKDYEKIINLNIYVTSFNCNELNLDNYENEMISKLLKEI